MHSYKKWENSLKVSQDGALLAAELVPRLPQNTSNINIEYVRKIKQLYSLYDQPLGARIYLSFIVLVLICF